MGLRPLIRNLFRPATSFVRSIIGTNGVSTQVATIDGKIEVLAQKLGALDQTFRLGQTSQPGQAPPQAPPGPPTEAHIDVNVLLHQSRSALMRDMPPGAKRLVSAGCAGGWYFDWIEQTYGHVQEHLGIEYYAPKPDGLPDNVTWIANTAGNMEAVESASCDLVISGQNVEHLWPDEVADFLVESARVLRAGGTLCMDSPNRVITALLQWSHPEHTIELTVPEVRLLLHLAGFDVTKEAGLWLCQDPRTGRVLPFDPNAHDPDWTVPERLVSARDKPERSMLWWLEGRRSERAPDHVAVGGVLADIFSRAWPERIQRLLVNPGRKTEQREDGAWVLARTGEGGMVFYGPYMPLRAGHYRVTFDVVPDPGTKSAYARCEVTHGTECLVLQECAATPGSNQVTLEIELSELTFGCQFRCISLGRSGFAVRRHVTLVETLREGAAVGNDKPGPVKAPAAGSVDLRPPAAPDVPDAPAQQVFQKGFAAATMPDGVAYQLSVDQDSADPWHAAVSTNTWQGPTWQFLMAWLRSGDVFFDLGANIGTVSIPAAIAGARVTSFEMLSSNIVHLERAVARNGLANITVVAGALSDRPGFAGLGGVSAWGMVAEEALVHVPTLVIDDYVRQKGIARVDVLKIDIEGSEQKALAGAAALLDRDHPDIIIEVNSLTCGMYGMSYRDLFRLMLGHGYRLYRIFPDSLAPWSPDMVQEASAPDYLATKKTEAEIAERSGWPVRAVTDADLVTSILTSAQYEGPPRLHVLAVADRLPAKVRTDPQVARLLEEWKPLKAEPLFETIRVGSA